MKLFVSKLFNFYIILKKCIGMPWEYLMIAFDQVIQRIKKIMIDDREGQRLYDKEIAQALNLTSEYFAVIKKRGKIPYEAIATFCQKREISINWILLGQGETKLYHEKNERSY